MCSVVLRSLRRATRPLYEFVYPPACVVCDAATPRRVGGVCLQCWESISVVAPENALLHQAWQRLCTEGSCHAVVADAVFEEGGTLQQIIHRLKYDGMTSIGIALGERLGRRLISGSFFPAIDGILPIPLHRTKERDRGYNQAKYIAVGISRSTGIPLRDDLLRRRKFTVTQTQLNAEGRRLNVAGAFAVPSSAKCHVQEKRFVLVDDVLTTGATTEAAARALVSAGAVGPIVCAVALAE